MISVDNYQTPTLQRIKYLFLFHSEVNSEDKSDSEAEQMFDVVQFHVCGPLNLNTGPDI